MKGKPSRFSAAFAKVARPKFGIGILVGVLLVIGTRVSGSDSAFAMVLGSGVGLALGLTARSAPEKFTDSANDEEEPEVRAR